MEQYLKKEKEILEQNNSDFFDNTKVVTEWYSVREGVILQHNKLIHAMGLQPEYIILYRFETDVPKRRISIYFNHLLEAVPFIPFGEWRLYDNIEQFKRYKYYNVQDPTGVIKTISLTEYIPYIPIHLKNYLKYDSFEAYGKSSNKDKSDAVDDESKPVELILEPGKNYLISVKNK